MIKLEYNYVLTAAVISWALAQLIKTVVFFIQNRSFNVERLIGSGGMPSSHSALVVSATVAVARMSGVASTEFAVCFLFAMVVMNDAMGVRRAAGQHAHEINKMNKLIESTQLNTIFGYDYKELKEFLGHTPFEVLGGAALGVAMAFIIPMQSV